ncbi:MAG: hypothetical protein ABFQ65_00850 [Nanoarchaeota archaeon]
MKKTGVLILFFVFLFPTIFAVSVNSEIQKITHFAEEYEIGNLNYVQLLVKISSVRQNLNELLGGIDFEGGILKQEQLKSFLGTPQDETKWVWAEGQNHEMKLDYYVPVWNKIIFDGNKIQIRLDAYPSILKYKFKDDVDLGFSENEIVYRLHFQIEFKKPKDELDIKSKINEVKLLAETFNSNPSNSNAEALAKESVNVEKIFNLYFRQNQGKCEDIMKSIFGAENLREIASTEVYEIEFYEAENFEAILRLEMCGDCEWSRINADFRLDGRGRFRIPEGKRDFDDRDSREKYKSMSDEDFKIKIKSILNEITNSLDREDYSEAMSLSNQLRTLNNAWNEKSNNVWEEIRNQFENTMEFMTEQQREEFNKNYGWIKQEQEQRKKAKDLQTHNFELRKRFYLDLFSDYNKREFYFKQSQYEQRLIEEFKEKGEEICNNNKDDNENEQIDCADSQCGGKFCGSVKGVVIVNNESVEQDIDLYCITSVCQQKDEDFEEEEIICGNNICEEGEDLSCAEDCVLCIEHSAIECEGNVIFSGTDEQGCPLEPICIEETETCEVDDDCQDLLCGDVSCVEGLCQVTELEECEEAECEEGQEKIKQCDSGKEIISEICLENLWKKTEIFCEEEPIGESVECVKCGNSCVTQEAITTMSCLESTEDFECIDDGSQCVIYQIEEEIVGVECIVKEDCGGENDVCSNGKCVTIPQVVEVVTGDEEEPIEIIELEVDEIIEEESSQESNSEPTPEPEESESAPQTPEITGETIFKLPAYLIMKLTGAITGKASDGEETVASDESAPEFEQESTPESVTEEIIGSPDEPQESQEIIEQKSDYEDEEKEDDKRRQEEEDSERRDREERERNEEQKERCDEECEKICYDKNVRSCVQKCIRESCGESLDCNIDEEQKNCEGQCKSDNECEEDCVPKCIKGGDWWKEFEMNPEDFDEHKEEKGVFTVGGGCRTSQSKTDGFIWFGGWGEPFEDLQSLKNKYYQGGESDWCKSDFENLKKQRAEFEKGFNQEFVVWFFEKYLPNSAENWEGAMSGIFELYWNDIDNSRQMAERMQCLGLEQLPSYNLINVKYETEYGSLEFWEEVKTVKLPGMEEEVEVISPYMKVWVFPSKEFIFYEMKQSMKNHEFPGSKEDKLERENQEGLTEEEKEMLKQDKNFMEKIKKVTDKYNGNVNAVIQFKDYEKDEVVFNLYAQINEEDILTMEPMLPEEVPEYDVKIEMDFEPIYEMILASEKDMRGTRIESPPWDRKAQPIQRVKEVTNGVKMYFKMRSLMNSAKVTPESAESDAKDLFREFFGKISKGKEDDRDREEDEFGDDKQKELEGDIFGQSKEDLTGEVIFGY